MYSIELELFTSVILEIIGQKFAIRPNMSSGMLSFCLGCTLRSRTNHPTSLHVYELLQIKTFPFLFCESSSPKYRHGSRHSSVGKPQSYFALTWHVALVQFGRQTLSTLTGDGTLTDSNAPSISQALYSKTHTDQNHFEQLAYGDLRAYIDSVCEPAQWQWSLPPVMVLSEIHLS